MVNRPESPSLSSSTAPTYSGSASSASRYSARVAAGQSWRPVADGVARAIANPQESTPVAVAAPIVDHADEAVEVGAMDQLIERRIGRIVEVVHVVGQTSGHG